MGRIIKFFQDLIEKYRNRKTFNPRLLTVKERSNQDLERQVLEKTHQIEEITKQKNKFLDNLSHEIRASVQIITNLSSIASYDWEKLDDSARKDIVFKISKNSGNLLFLINNVLDISKFHSGRMLFDMKVNNLETVTKSVLEELQILANEKNIKIDFYKNKHIELNTIFDKERISQVIRNLIINAIKYSKKDSHIRVDLLQKYATLPTGITINGLCLAIKDLGIGIPEKELKTIFEPFEVSSNSNKRKDSTGLGLSISLEIVNEHNGVIWAENNKGSDGVTFYCVLPYSNNIVSKDDNKSAKKKFTLLFVDDEEGSRVAGRMILENIGYTVKVFASGHDLLDFLKYSGKKPDLMLLDMLMPDLDGVELVKKLRNISEYKNVPIILQTGKYDLNLEELKQYSPIGYIAKPYNKEQLKNAVEKHLHESRLEASQ